MPHLAASDARREPGAHYHDAPNVLDLQRETTLKISRTVKREMV